VDVLPPGQLCGVDYRPRIEAANVEARSRQFGCDQAPRLAEPEHCDRRRRYARASRMARQTFSPLHGMSTVRTLSGRRASTTALCTAGVEPIVPDSPIPLAPRALAGVGVSISTTSQSGSSEEAGNA